jgi:predicted ATPase
VEAIGQLSRAVELVGTLPHTREHKDLELPLQITLGQALYVTQGYASVEAEQAHMRARDLAEQLGDTSQLLAVLYELRSIHGARAEHDKSRLIAEELLRLARGTSELQQLLRALLAMAVTSYWRGEFSEALEHAKELLGLYDPEKHRGHEYVSFGANIGVWGKHYFGWTMLNLGYLDQALRTARESLALAQKLSHPLSEATALCCLYRVHLERGESQDSLKKADALIALSGKQGFPYWLAIGTMGRFQAVIEEGQLQEGIAGMCSVSEGMRARGEVMGLSWSLSRLARAHGKTGEVEEGLAVVTEAMEFMTKTGECAAAAEWHRVKGDLLLGRTPADQAGAETAFRDALEVARRQSTKLYELRTAMSLASLWQQQGRKEEARDLLAPVYDWFTEGFDTRDLKEAKVLLEELA